MTQSVERLQAILTQNATLCFDVCAESADVNAHVAVSNVWFCYCFGLALVWLVVEWTHKRNFECGCFPTASPLVRLRIKGKQNGL